MIASALRTSLLDALWPRGLPAQRKVWTILDAARDPAIFGTVDGTYLEKCCLYGGDLPWQLQMAAPYLVELRKDHEFTGWAIGRGWGNAWGIFLRADADMKVLRRHLRGFLRVRGPREKRLLFRYYDPRVLRVYLPTCTPDELRTVFGPIDRFVMEADDPHTALEYGFDGIQLSETRIALQAAPRC